MNVVSKPIARSLPLASRALVAASIALASLTGCHTEVEPSRDKGEEANTGQAKDALTVTYYDFIANAPGAAWHNNDGGVPWGTNDGRGAAYSLTGALETGATTPYLFTHPKLGQWNGFMHAAYTVTIPAAPYHPTATATFGFVQGSNGTNGVTFGLVTQVNGNWVTLFSQTKGYTGALATKTADLSAFAGQTITLFLIADANGGTDWDWAAWTDFRIIGDSGPLPPDGCVISGVNYAQGAVHPTIPCQICDRAENPIGWSVRPDSCYIGSTCYAADALDSVGCKRCDPLTSQTLWTNKTGCDNLVVANTNAVGGGGGYVSGVAGADSRCASEGAALYLPGTWKALLSQPGARDLRDTVPPIFASSKPVVNLKGEQLYGSWDSIFTNQVWPAGLDMYRIGTATNIVGSAYAGSTWSGSGPNGRWLAHANGNNCNNWHDEGYWSWWVWYSYFTHVGDFSQRKLVDSGYGDTSNAVTDCNTAKPLTCILIPPEPPIVIENYDGTALGSIKGKSQANAIAYLGLPYAAPPTGSLRLAPPAKATSWTGVRNAFGQAVPCPQPPLLPLGGMIGSEDCLYLNVWAPKSAVPTSNLPVLVFQHGGGHMFGGTSSSDDWLAPGYLDGDRLAVAQNAVVVTIQTRVGALGYLADPALSANTTSRTSAVGSGTSGNYGLLDAIQALKWVKRNIAKFGGDPNKVTFAGQSSGSTIVCSLLASPLAKDPADNKPYFANVIMESGFCESPLTSFRYSQASTYMASIGCDSAPDKVACLRAAPLQSIVNTSGNILSFFPTMFAGALPPEFAFGLKFGPNIDGYVLPAQPRTMFAAGTHNKVPAIVGSNKDEGTFVMLFMVGGILSGDLPNFIVLVGCNARDTKVGINLGTTLANAAKSFYPCYDLDLLSPTKTFAQAITHVQYECPARRTLRALKLGQTQPVRRYWFTHGGDHLGIIHNVLGLVRDVGAAHTFEIPFIFNTHNTVLWYWPSTRERNLTTAIQSYWRAYMASGTTGDPNYSGGVNWTAYASASDNALKLEVTGKDGPSDPGLQMVNGIDTTQCDFWDNNFTLDGWK